MDWLYSLIWYAALIWGVVRAYGSAVKSRHATVPLDKARHISRALFTCGIVLFVFGMLDDAKRDIHSLLDPMEWIDVLGNAVFYTVLFLLPTWLPLRLLSGQPGSERCGFAAFIARAVAVFAGACMAITPFMFLFANSLTEYGLALLTVGIPISILVYVALKTGKYASLAGDALDEANATRREPVAH